MKRYEYTTYNPYPDRIDLKKLNEFSREGWRLAKVLNPTNKASDVLVVLEREIPVTFKDIETIINCNCSTKYKSDQGPWACLTCGRVWSSEDDSE